MAKNIDKAFLLAFGTNLKKVREQKNITQAQLAIDCDFDVSIISRIERGAVNTSLSIISLIAKSMKIPVKELFEFEVNNHE